MNIEQAFEKLHEEAEGSTEAIIIYCSKEIINNALKGKGEIKAVYLETQSNPNNFTIWVATERTIEKLIYNNPIVKTLTIQLKDIVDFQKEYELTGDSPPGREPILKKITFTINGRQQQIVRPEYWKAQKRYQEFGNSL